MDNDPIDPARLEELEKLGSAHFWPHNRPIGNVSQDGVCVVVRGEGIWIDDARGNRWLDMMSGMWLKNVGHGRKEIADAVAHQMMQISYAPGGTVSPVTIELAARLAKLSPDPEARVFFVSGGTEAVETALKMARKYHRNRGEGGRYKIIGRRGSYHGATLATIGIGGATMASTPDYGPLAPGNVQAANVEPYRCVFCKERQACTLECANDIERTIIHEGPDTIAAVIAEPISVSNGVFVPPDAYWPRLRELCDRHGILLIADEVITGFGRTGKMFAVEHWGIRPDIMTVAKGLTSGYLPIGAVIASKKVSEAFAGGETTHFRHLITFGGNPASCAAALANLDIIEREKLVENSSRLGAYFFERLGRLRAHPIVGDVRGGKGLLAAVELVRDRETRAHFPPEARLPHVVERAFAAQGLLGRAIDAINVAPPLCITREEVDELVTRLDRAMADASKQLG